MATQAQQQALPYERIGERAGVAALVERFYDLMEKEPAFAELRALHAEDLGPMRHSLTLFLTAWMGGPRDWFTEKPNVCVMSAHNRFPIGKAEKDQWLDCMRQAMADTGVEPDLATILDEAFGRMASAMQNR